MQQNMINNLQAMLQSKHPTMKIDYGNMVNISDKSRLDTVNALAQQYQRFRQAAPIPKAPEMPNLNRFSSCSSYPFPTCPSPGHSASERATSASFNPQIPKSSPQIRNAPIDPIRDFKGTDLTSSYTPKRRPRRINNDSGYSSPVSDADTSPTSRRAYELDFSNGSPGFCPGALRIQSDDSFLVPDVWTCFFCNKTFALRGDPIDSLGSTSKGLEGMHPAFWFKQHITFGGQQYQRCTICLEQKGVATDLMTVPQWNHHINGHFMHDGYEMCRDKRGMMQRRSQCGKAPYYCNKIHAGVQ